MIKCLKILGIKKDLNRQKCKNYIIEKNILYFTGFGGKNNTKLKIPFNKEKTNILFRAHNNNGHLGIRSNDKIKEFGYFLETQISDIKEYISNCPKCIKAKAGKKINNKIKIILPKGPLERVLIDGWELDDNLKEITGYTWVIDMIDHFSKYLLSKAVKNNNTKNIQICMKNYFNCIGYPKIIQSDNGSEYKNAIINNLLTSNNIKQIFSSHRHPQTNGVVEIVHKEVRKNILNNLDLIEDAIFFENILLDCVLVHNNNTHTVTGYKPVFLIKNEDDDIYNNVIENINKTFKINEDVNKEFYVLKEGDHLLSKNGAYKNGKIIKCGKTKYKTEKLPMTIIKNYYCGIINIRVDANLYSFHKGELYLIVPIYCKLINENEWNKIINEIIKNEDKFSKNLEVRKKSKKKNLKYRKNRINDEN